MTQPKKPAKLPRRALTIGAGIGVAGLLVLALRPQPMLVDFDTVERGPMQLRIVEEGRTRVHEPYVVSSPVAGTLQRVTALPGDAVVAGDTIVAQMHPANPTVLDVRTREQAQAAVLAAQAALNVAKADLNAAIANRDFARHDYDRIKTLVDRDIASVANLERAEQSKRVSEAAVETARAAIAMREAELSNAEAQLIGIEDQGLSTAVGDAPEVPSISLRAPIDGRILRIIEKSETTLPVGSPILEIGNVENDLEVMTELLSTDAVQVSLGDPVLISNWGGSDDLVGHVDRIDPYGYTKYSALGVEEQRVEVTIRFDNPVLDHESGLGHGYRVDAQIIVWETDDTLIVPSAALFRKDGAWSVFSVIDGTARTTTVEIGPNNGIEAQVLSGLEAGAVVIPFPPSGLADGQSVAQR